YVLSCDRAGTPLTAARFTATHTIDTPVRSMYGDLLIPVAGATPFGLFNGVALGVWRTADPFTLTCSAPITAASTTPSLLIGQGYMQQPINIVFDDVTSQCTQSVSVMTAYDPCLGTDVALPPGQVAEVRIWPVPATDHVSVAATDVERIDILDASGRLVLSMAAQGASTTEVDIARLAAGPYQVRIATGTGVYVRRIVKE
ncbi:MAG: T9SS type A sorting domain-containing protein, partial [Flavobacteriales bacterium]